MIVRISRSGTLSGVEELLFNRTGRVVLRGAMLHSDDPNVRLSLVADGGGEVITTELCPAELYAKGFTRRVVFWPYVAVYDTVNNSYLAIYDPKVQREFRGRFYVVVDGPAGAGYDVAVELDYEEV